MKRTYKIGMGIALFVSTLLFMSFGIGFNKAVDWEFIQSIGGIKIETPLETENGYYLPVICNVSGTDSITITPTVINSALSCIKIKSKIAENNIHLEVITGVSISKQKDCNCKATNLGWLKSGHYNVYYGDKNSSDHKIGSFYIE